MERTLFVQTSDVVLDDSGIINVGNIEILDFPPDDILT
jgi:hypothetical protein